MAHTVEEINAYFESKLALALAARAELLPLVDTISQYILSIIDTRREDIVKALSEPEKFKALKDELYGTMLGALVNEHGAAVTPEQALDDLAQTLKEQTHLLKIMPMHAVFGYRVLRLLYPERYDEIRKDLPVNDLVQDKQKYVKARPRDAKLKTTKQLGLCESTEYNWILERSHDYSCAEEALEYRTTHTTSRERFCVTSREKFDEYFPTDVPLVAGPSTHTITAITALKLYMELIAADQQKPFPQEKFSEDALRKYVLAYFSYLGSACYHSFHEIMKVASVCLNFRYGEWQDCVTSYINNLPTSLLDNEEIHDIIYFYRNLIFLTLNIRINDQQHVEISGFNHFFSTSVRGEHFKFVVEDPDQIKILAEVLSGKMTAKAGFVAVATLNSDCGQDYLKTCFDLPLGKLLNNLRIKENESSSDQKVNEFSQKVQKFFPFALCEYRTMTRYINEDVYYQLLKAAYHDNNLSQTDSVATLPGSEESATRCKM